MLSKGALALLLYRPANGPPDDIAVSNPRSYRPPLPVDAYGSHATSLILLEEKKWRTCALICSHSRAHQTNFSERGKRPSIKEEDGSVFAHRAPAEHYTGKVTS